MYQVYYNTPTRAYLEFTGSYDECKKYAEDNKTKLSYGYYFVIRRTVDYLAVKRINA